MSNKSKTLKISGYEPISFALTTGRLMLAQSKDLDIANIENGLLGGMFMDPIKLARAAWVLYGDRINDAGIDTETEFYELLDDQTNRELDECIKNAVSDFFTWGKDYVDQVDRVINNLGKEMQKAMEGQEETEEKPTSGEPSGKVQESAA